MHCFRLSLRSNRPNSRGSFRQIYEIDAKNSGKFKAIKLSFSDHLHSGMMYTQERSVFHGDIELRNVLCSWAIPLRFDLMDFEDGMDLSTVHTVEEFFNQLRGHNRNSCIRMAQPNLSDAEYLELCKKWLLAQDALSFRNSYNLNVLTFPNCSIKSS